MKMINLGKILFAVCLSIVPLVGHAQQYTFQSGTINEVMQDDGYIIIDGERIKFPGSADVVITYKEQEVRSSFLAAGMTIRYKLDSEGKISEIVLTGPARMLEEIDNH